MHTLVKLTLRLTTKVTTSPACRRRISSAVAPTAVRSRPRASASTIASSTPSSAPSRTAPRMRRTACDVEPRGNSALPASPVFMAVLYEARRVEQGLDARAKGFGDELGPPRELRIHGQALTEGEALALGRAAQLGDERPRALGIDVIEGQR